MEIALYWTLIVVVVLALYILLSGAAFVTIYRFPDAAPTGFYSWFFEPLDWIARRVPTFGAAYNGFHQWCYRTFAHHDHET
jgi:hypothetical protein